MKIHEIAIETCSDCPFLRRDEAGVNRCHRSPGKRGEQFLSVASPTTEIADFCPLADEANLINYQATKTALKQALAGFQAIMLECSDFANESEMHQWFFRCQELVALARGVVDVGELTRSWVQDGLIDPYKQEREAV